MNRAPAVDRAGHTWRLAPAAGLAWGGCAVALRHPDVGPALVMAGSAVVAGVLFGWVVPSRSSAWRGTRAAGGDGCASPRWRWPGLLLVAVVCGTGLTAGAVGRDLARTATPLAGATGTTQRVEVATTGDPRALGARPGALVNVRARAMSAVADDSWTPALVIGGGQWLEARRGARYTAIVDVTRPDRPWGPEAVVLRARTGPSPRAPAPWLWRRAEAVRQAVRSSAAGLPGSGPALLPALVTGDTAGIDDDLRGRLETAGLMHLAAVSGTNVTVVCGGVLAALAAARSPRWVLVAGGGAALSALVLVARPDPSVLRAVVMGGVGLLGLMTGPPGRAGSGLAVAVLVVLAVDPWLALSYGFALSVSATAGIAAAAGPLSAMLRRRIVWCPAPVSLAVAATASAQVAVTPVLVLLDPVLTPWALPANLLVGPVAGFAMLCGSVVAVLAVLTPPLAPLLAWLAWPAVEWTAAVAGVVAGLPGARLPWPGGVPGAWIATGAVVAAVAVWLRRRPLSPEGAASTAGGPVRGGAAGPVRGRFRRAHAATAAAAVVILVLGLGYGGCRSGIAGPWSAIVCDVGQGQAVLLRAGPGAAVVVDTGPDPAGLTRCLRRAQVAAVPLLVLTHPHADHVGGTGALAHLPIEEVWHSPAWSTAEAAGAGSRPRARWRAVGPGTVSRVGEVELEVLWPSAVLDPAGVAAGAGSAVNDAGLVLRASTAAGRVLVLGDVETAAQGALLRDRGGDVSADVVVVAHHGSASQEPRLYEAIGAPVAVVSAGRGNEYGHPSPRAVAMLQAVDSQVFVTAYCGDVTVAAGAATGRRPATVRTSEPCRVPP